MSFRHCHRRGFTLIEMTLSISILAIILVACMSALVLLSRGTSARANTQRTNAQTDSAKEAMAQLTSDLKLATAVISKSSTSISIRVPDRDGDASPETITYSWGATGDPLKRYYNSDSSYSTILENVQKFSLGYVEKTVSSLQEVESDETLLSSYTGTQNAYSDLTKQIWECQYFTPTSALPSDAMSWKITRVQFMLKRNLLATGNLSLKIYAADASGKPTGNALASGTISVTSLSSLLYAWTEIPLAAPLANLDPASGVALVVSSSSSSVNGSIGGTISISPVLTDRKECYTTKAGASWSTPSGAGVLQFKAYGTYTAMR